MQYFLMFVMLKLLDIFISPPKFKSCIRHCEETIFLLFIHYFENIWQEINRTTLFDTFLNFDTEIGLIVLLIA